MSLDNGDSLFLNPRKGRLMRFGDILGDVPKSVFYAICFVLSVFLVMAFRRRRESAEPASQRRHAHRRRKGDSSYLFSVRPKASDRRRSVMVDYAPFTRSGASASITSPRELKNQSRSASPLRTFPPASAWTSIPARRKRFPLARSANVGLA